MLKADSLRAAITAAVPGLNANPDKFLVFADAGRIVANGAPGLSFEYRYTLNLILLDFAGDADRVMIALLQWALRHQPDLVNHPERRTQAIAFEVDQNNNATCDLSIKLPLTESVNVTTGADGAHLVEHMTEPELEWMMSGLGG